MDQWVFLLFVLVLAGMVIIALALIINERLRARIYLPGRAEFFIDTRRGWNQVPKPIAPRKPPVQKKERNRPRRAWLVAKVRRGPDWEYQLGDKAQVYIGRHPDNDIVLRDKSADTRHAVIYFQDGRYRINNLSHKGTKVNNRWITWQRLGNGNRIQMGNTVLIFRQDSKTVHFHH